MHYISAAVAVTCLLFGFSDAVITITYRCAGDNNHVGMPNICKNLCWGQNCLKLVSDSIMSFNQQASGLPLTHASMQGTQFTFDSTQDAAHRAQSGATVPNSANRPCGAGSAFGDATLSSIDEYPLASSRYGNTLTGSLRCASTQEQQGKLNSLNFDLSQCEQQNPLRFH